MGFWTILRWLGVCASVVGGLSLILGVLRARRSGHRAPMQRGFIALGVGSLLIAAYALLPADADIPRLSAIWIAAGLSLIGARWIKRAADEVESNKSHVGQV